MAGPGWGAAFFIIERLKDLKIKTTRLSFWMKRMSNCNKEYQSGHSGFY